MNSIDFAKRVRIESLKMCNRANASHIGSALSIVDIVSVLYNDILNITKNKLKASDRDRFILSKGHACVAVYSALALKNIIDQEELDSYGKNFSRLMNHISHKVPGVEFSTGSLGHGLPFATGKALALKIKDNNSKVFVLCSDGELDEGSNWEALLFASHHNLYNLTIIIDYNNLQSLTTIDKTLSLEPLFDKFKSFNLNVEVVDGHDHESLKDMLSKNNKKPTVVIANTTKGKGVSFMENKVEWHYKSPNKEELALAIREIDFA
jgi:transketolase